MTVRLLANRAQHTLQRRGSGVSAHLITRRLAELANQVGHRVGGRVRNGGARGRPVLLLLLHVRMLLLHRVLLLHRALLLLLHLRGQHLGLLQGSSGDGRKGLEAGV